MCLWLWVLARVKKEMGCGLMGLFAGL
uniref:Uncharacterized protein n=1 Tax=Arundo donax TaxID=35708 RepID=A0A0A9B051_ARUDO